ncbi:MAG TPA: hypothetical protein VMR62_08860 [Bryobacteraceae bacterium]|jgi:hypothetical protein|nr:hypothetical protein [Bryobacteraceae bacterium]
MPPTAKKRKDPAAVALGRKGGKKGGLARAAKLTPAERSESARKAVQARWAKTKTKRSADYIVNKGETADMKTFNESQINEAMPAADTSDHAFMSLLKRYKATNDPTEMETLSEQIERMIFHKQYENVKA